MRSPVGFTMKSIMIRRRELKHAFHSNLRIDVKTGRPKGHGGWDIWAPVGSPVMAVADGEIAMVFPDDGVNEFGNHIALRFHHNGQDLFAIYAHLRRMDVRVGQHVREGDKLGTSGQTGNARGQGRFDEHLHLEFRKTLRGPVIDPMLVLGFAPIADVIFADLRDLGN